MIILWEKCKNNMRNGLQASISQLVMPVIISLNLCRPLSSLFVHMEILLFHLLITCSEIMYSGWICKLVMFLTRKHYAILTPHYNLKYLYLTVTVVFQGGGSHRFSVPHPAQLLFNPQLCFTLHQSGDRKHCSGLFSEK